MNSILQQRTSTLSKTSRQIAVTFAIAALMSLTAGCSSSDAATGDLLEPTITVKQLNGRIPLNQIRSAPIDLNVEIQITNRSQEEFVLKRLSVQSLAGGAYGVPSQNRTYDERIPGGATRIVNMWFRAYLQPDQPLAPVEALTLRGSAIFQTEFGRKRTPFLESITLSTSR